MHFPASCVGTCQSISPDATRREAPTSSELIWANSLSQLVVLTWLGRSARSRFAGTVLVPSRYRFIAYGPHAQTFLALQPLHPLANCHPPLTSQQGVGEPIAETRQVRRDLAQP